MVSSSSLLLINFCFYRKLFFTNVVSSSLPWNLFLVWSSYSASFTLHKKMKFSIIDFFSKCDQIRSFCSFLRIWSHLPKKSLMEIFTFAQCQRELFHWFYATFGVTYYFAVSSPLWPEQVLREASGLWQKSIATLIFCIFDIFLISRPQKMIFVLVYDDH